MTKKELIEALSRFDDDAEIYFKVDRQCEASCQLFENVYLDADGDIIVE